MKKIIAVNGSPRKGWNTDILINEAAKGAKEAGAEVKVYDLYRMDNCGGCKSCFACKLEPNKGKCVYPDGMAELLEDIRTADGLILGSPNYLGDITAGMRALYERLIFQYITYKKEPSSYSERKIPVMLVMTSNAPQEIYDQMGYTARLEGYAGTISHFIGPVKTLVCGNTLQVNNYDRYNWTNFDVEAKKERRETVFPAEMQNACDMGREMAEKGW
ncbi:MAG: flavodoxin family protein [Oscillospiraceae bacterium]|nr:flavodoxin family protein [Oscillospiraceae bacterium]